MDFYNGTRLKIDIANAYNSIDLLASRVLRNFVLMPCGSLNGAWTALAMFSMMENFLLVRLVSNRGSVGARAV